MVIKLLPNQVPQYWDMIKFVAVNADRVKENDRPLYLNRLLHALLSSKAQCFFRLDDERKVTAVEITRLVLDEVTGEKALFLNCLYSFKVVSEDQWKSDIAFVKEFAKKEGCKKLIGYSNHQRVFDIMQSIGFEERYRCYVMEV